ncbi:alcohol dehydrogenase AdhP [Flexibacterium corallicola]|uniref:alcohol dehydrogenase AdhP n=1 Tax=Flexibacterium corallicola TaxID=3037259 RepID=UPI00286EE488|nr:alcohol dehydrogenase AdhP [Pseudovibrio sp. M1P-2-3]
MAMMKAAVVRKFGEPLDICEVPVPEVSEDSILVKIEATGVCHTDLHAAHGDWPVKPSPPFIPGHEGVGIVVKAGSSVSNVKEGDRVGVPWLHTACRCCHHCVGGWETLCTHQSNTGYSVNGSFAEYSLADPNFVAHIPNKLEFAPAAPILCAGVTVYKALKETEAKPGQTVVISGIGGLGHLAVQYAKAMGMHVIAVDIADDKLSLAKSLGADMTVNALNEDPIQAVQAGGGAEGVLITAVAGKAFEQGVGMLARGGTMSLVGLPPENFPLSIFDLVLNRKTVRGSIVGTRNDLAESLQLAAEGKATAHYTTEPLDNINDIFDRMIKGKIDGRIVMDL